MGPSARVAAFASAVTLAACAVIAGLDDPQTVADATSAEAGSSGSLQDTGSGSSSGGSSANDGASDGAPSSGDAQPDVPACTLLPNGDNCTQPSQCCSNKCNEKKQCANECKTQGTF